MNRCIMCGSINACVCSRVRSMLSDRLGSHYNADELIDWVVRVAKEAALQETLRKMPLRKVTLRKGKKHG
jgi:hypothetical protein